VARSKGTHIPPGEAPRGRGLARLAAGNPAARTIRSVGGVRRLSFAVAAAVAALGVVSLAGAQRTGPSTLRLPNGFQPEGISISGRSFYVGSIPTGAVYRGSLVTGRGSLVVRGAPGHAAIGLEVDRGRIFVAGGDTGRGFVYDARTGRELATYEFVAEGAGFVNDVVVTRRAAWFTDSRNAFLYRLPLGAGGRPPAASGFQKVPLRGQIRYVSGFNVNGIDAASEGRTLVIVQSNTGRLFTVNPTTGVTRGITLRGGVVANGDGILLSGRSLYVVRNQDNAIAVVRLSSDLRRGTVLRSIADRRFDVPTTIDEAGRFLYAVNARFGTNPTPSTRYDVVRVPKLG
jgi:outer membrane protein assembly factor BamB